MEASVKFREFTNVEAIDFTRGIFSQNYLNFFDTNNIGNKLPGVSVIVPTFNRSPNPVGKDSNPLEWCLNSLNDQKGTFLGVIKAVLNINKVIKGFVCFVSNHNLFGSNKIILRRTKT